jgi:2-polyprenyl-3-methyl-5-hydroxy-6-metoxy-1,4-benzoquinol methylase
MYNDLLYKAFYFHRKNRFELAASIYACILSQDPDNHHAKHYLGLIYLQTGHIEHGKALIESSIGQVKHYPEAIHNLSVFDRSIDAKIAQEIGATPDFQAYQLRAEGTVGAWRMERMLDCVDVFAQENGTWLTIGDAYGHDAQILESKGVKNVHASNLDIQNLAEGARRGLVKEYSQINAEKIEFDENSFDYVLCKEALHHMPRPYAAIYEMMRVARVATILIEPSDPLIDYFKPEGALVERRIESKEQAVYVEKKVVYAKNAGQNRDDITEVFVDWYEDGAFNYVYTLSRREMSKLCFGMGLPAHALKSYNDIYVAEINDLSIESSSDGFQRLKSQLEVQDWLCKISGMPPNYITAILFKQSPSVRTTNLLSGMNYETQITPTIFMPFKFVHL